MSSSFILRAAQGEIPLFNQPVIPYHDVDGLDLLRKGYIQAIDAMVRNTNQNPNVPDSIRKDIDKVMVSIVLDADAAKEIAKSTKDITKREPGSIPLMSTIVSIIDIDLDIDIMEAIYFYIAKLLKGCDKAMPFPVMGDMAGRLDSYRYSYLNDDGKEIDITNELSANVAKNKRMRERVIKALGTNKPVTQEKILEFRRKYKLDPDTKEFKKREKEVSKTIYESMAAKYLKLFQ